MCTRVEQKVKKLKHELRDVEQRIVETVLAFNKLAAQMDPPLTPMDVAAPASAPSPDPLTNACDQPWKTGATRPAFMDPPADAACMPDNASKFTVPYAPDPNQLTLYDPKGHAINGAAEAATLRTDVEYLLKS